MLFSIVIFNLVNLAYSRNILGLMGCASHSHELWNRVIFNELTLQREYNLTILSVDVTENHPKNIHYIHLEETYNSIFTYDDKYDILKSILSGSFKKVNYFYDYHLLTCRGILNSKGFQVLQQYPNSFKFDLILYDVSMGPCLIGFLHKFNYPPVIGISAFKIFPGIIDVVGGHSYPAYIPHFSLPYDVDMNFLERLHNTAIHIYDYLYKTLIFQPKLEAMAKLYYTNDTPSLIELDKLTSIVLVNTYPVIDFPEPLPPNVIEVGGLKITETKNLSGEIDSFMNKSKKGTVLVSLGTNMQSKIVGNERQIAILNAISRLPEYNFIWKTDRETLPKNLSSNVMIRSWIPQTDILADCRTKAFVTHAGSLSVQEAIWYAVPMVTIPLFVDQPRNAHKVTKLKIAEKVDFATLTEEKVYTAIKNVLQNPLYSMKVRKYSEKFRDRPMKPLDLAIWWIEYVMRQPNMDHLKSPTLKLNYIRSNLIDIVIFVTVIMFGIYFLVQKIFRLILCVVNARINSVRKYKIH